MKQEESFFINLFKKRNTIKSERKEFQLNDIPEENIETTDDNEWKQEYELIYQSYCLELY